MVVGAAWCALLPFFFLALVGAPGWALAGVETVVPVLPGSQPIPRELRLSRELDARPGEVLWEIPNSRLGADVAGQIRRDGQKPVFFEGLILISTGRTLWSVDAVSGAVASRYDPGGFARVQVMGGRVYLYPWERQDDPSPLAFSLFDPRSGRILWRASPTSLYPAGEATSGPIVSTHRLGAGSNAVGLLDPSTGEWIWKRPLSRPLHGGDGERLVDLGDRLLLADGDRLWLLESWSGEPLFSRRYPGTDIRQVSVDVGSGVFFFTSLSAPTRVHAGRLADGELLWSRAYGSELWSGAQAYDGLVFFSAGWITPGCCAFPGGSTGLYFRKETLTAADARSGRERWHYGRQVSAPFRFGSGNVYALNGDTYVLLAAATGEVLRAHEWDVRAGEGAYDFANAEIAASDFYPQDPSRWVLRAGTDFVLLSVTPKGVLAERIGPNRNPGAE